MIMFYQIVYRAYRYDKTYTVLPFTKTEAFNEWDFLEYTCWIIPLS